MQRFTTREMIEIAASARREARRRLLGAHTHVPSDAPLYAELQRQVLGLRAIETRLHALALAEEAEAAKAGNTPPTTTATLLPDERPATAERQPSFWWQREHA